MAAQQQKLNLASASFEDDEPMQEHLLESSASNGVNRKKKIALIGPAIDKLASHVRWGTRLSSSFYRTIGLNISVRTVTTETPSTNVDIDFVVWQLSPKLSPSLLKSLMRGASALIVAVGQTHESSQFRECESEFQNASQSKNASVAAKHYYPSDGYLTEESDYIWSDVEGNAIDIDTLDKSANQLKMPIAFIHFIESGVTTLNGVDRHQGLEKVSHGSDIGDNQIVKLHETEHSLHLGLSSEENSEHCLCQAFDYIAEHFVYAA